MSLTEHFSDGEITNYINSKKVDVWEGTVFEGYLKMSPTQMGSVGEKLVTKIMRKRKSLVEDRLNRGHDIIVDGYKTEVKFSLSKTEKTFIFNHLSIKKDWDRVILLGVNSEETYYMYWFDKSEFSNIIKSTKNPFKYQQGGEDVENDDYMYTGDIDVLYNTGLLHNMDTWLNQGTKKSGIELWMSE